MSDETKRLQKKKRLFHVPPRRTFKERLICELVSFFAVILIKCIMFTVRCDIRRMEIWKDLIDSEKGFIYAFWHGRLFVPAYMIRNRDARILVSQSRDGDIGARLGQRLGYVTLRGSSYKGAFTALESLLQHAESGPVELALACDGPRGPRCTVGKGVILLASKTRLPIIPVIISMKSYWQLSTWDQFRIPKPFSLTAIEICDPFEVPLEVSNKDVKQYQQKLQDIINDGTRRLDEELVSKKPRMA